MKTRGFTLMEVLVALLILALSLTFILQGMGASHRLMVRAKERSRLVDREVKVLQEVIILRDSLLEEVGEEGIWEVKGKGFVASFEERSLPAGEGSYRVVRVRVVESNGTIEMEAPLP